MDVDFPLLKTVPLFRGIADEERRDLLNCLGARVRRVPKNGVLLRAGDPPRHIGVVLSGTLHIIKETEDGGSTLVAPVVPGEIFAEALCCAGVAESPVTVLADEAASVLLLRFDHVLGICQNACPYHRKLLENLLKLVAEKSLYLQNRLDILSLKSIREKLLRYLTPRAQRPHAPFTVPFNREQLAAYLGVERSALSHELMKMKHDGLLEYKKNTFVLK
ncbi:MAG: Crp/Fnr family transcriptional regulator [Oscillospiraceae bacterium]|nr:Crp/Fnr family transcriptional regulator [Oscillospiraceae bacterium]